MRTQYVFSLSDEWFGELVYSRRIEGNHVYAINHCDQMGTRVLVAVTVCEGDTAEREFFNHFGDDSSWPPGWWARMTEDKFTRLSWERENYSGPKL